MKNLNYKFEGWYKQTHWMSPKLTLSASGDYEEPVVQNMYTAYRAGFNRANKERRELYSNDAALMKQALDALNNTTPRPLPIDDDYAEGAWGHHQKVITALRERLGEKE